MRKIDAYPTVRWAVNPSWRCFANWWFFEFLAKRVLSNNFFGFTWFRSSTGWWTRHLVNRSNLAYRRFNIRLLYTLLNFHAFCRWLINNLFIKTGMAMFLVWLVFLVFFWVLMIVVMRAMFWMVLALLTILVFMFFIFLVVFTHTGVSAVSV